MNTTFQSKITDLKINRTESSRIHEIDFDNLQFGREFSDHMVEMNYSNGAWNAPEIKPYGPIAITPACSALHYGQAFFEGMKAYYTVQGEIAMFRPEKNATRFNKSALRISMPDLYIYALICMPTITTLVSELQRTIAFAFSPVLLGNTTPKGFV